MCIATGLSKEANLSSSLSHSLEARSACWQAVEREDQPVGRGMLPGHPRMKERAGQRSYHAPEP